MNKKIVFLLLFFLSGGLFLKLPDVFASSFSNTYIRLDHQTPNAALSGTACAQPSSAGAGTESQVTITFPSDFTVSANANSWTANVSNLPSGATIWPSIGTTATSVSGQSVTFSSADLTSNSLYCFNFAGASSTTGSIGDDKTGTITTKNSSNTTIDLATYTVSIISNNQIGISATIPPPASYLPISIESTTTGDNFPQDTTIDYKITYGLLTEVAFPLTIQAQWSQGTIAGNPTPSVDILDYVVGSASNAYGATSAVVDTVNRTITWTISSFPGNTINQTLTFKLKTNSSYTGGNSVSFSVFARTTSESTTTPDESVTKNYKYSVSSTTPTPTPTSSPSTTETPTPTPTLAPEILAFKDISVRNLTPSEAQIYVETDNKSVFSLNYGTSLRALSKNIKTADFKTQELITLPDLTANTDYYFKITATDENGKSKTSDIFTFKTALTSDVLKADLQTLVVASNNIILLSPTTKGEVNNQPKKNVIIIPVSTVFNVQFMLTKHVPIKVAQLIVRNKSVLGISTMEADASSDYANLVEIEPGVYAGKLKSLPTPGVYEIYVRLIDFNGNITEQKISDLIVANKFTILEKGTGKPIENARVLLYLYNSESKVYKLISPQELSITNPAFSKPDGTLDLVLVNGKYKAKISALNYGPQTIEFEINQQGKYPLVELERQSFNIINELTYYKNSFMDTFNATANFVRARADSNRLFDLITMGAIFIFVISTILAFSVKTHIPVFYLPYFLIYKTDLLLKRNKSYVFLGQVVDEITKIPVSKAVVSLIDSGNNTVATLKTNKLGEFYYPNINLGDYKISVTKDGFEKSPLISFSETANTISFIIALKKDESKLEKQARSFFVYVVDFIGMIFEFMLIIGIIVEIFLMSAFGILRIAPFMTITIVNLLLFFLFLYKPRNLQA